MKVENMRTQKFITLGSTLVVLGIVFGENRLIGYSFIGAGVLVSIIGAVKSRGKLWTKSNGTGGV
jgi:hypothetical protein